MSVRATLVTEDGILADVVIRGDTFEIVEGTIRKAEGTSGGLVAQAMRSGRATAGAPDDPENLSELRKAAENSAELGDPEPGDLVYAAARGYKVVAR